MRQVVLRDFYRSCFAAKSLLLKLHYNAKSGHVGSSLSCLEILSFIHNCCRSTEDTLILSKGHAASALYSVLATAGDISEEELTQSYYADATLFSAHPPPNKLSGIPFATGSLGHGPGISAGLALGARLRAGTEEDPSLVFCVVSDGELNEGSVWESFNFAAHHKLSNLVFFIDKNNIQGFGRTTDVMNMEPLGEKLRAFGLETVECDGHNIRSLVAGYDTALSRARSRGTAAIVVANTIKGRGLPGLADTIDCHYLPMSADVFAGALQFCETEVNQLLTNISDGDERCELNSARQ